MELPRDAGSIPAASTVKGLAICRKSFFIWYLRISQAFSASPKSAKYPILYPIVDYLVSDFV